ncbi:MAG: SLC13 family permease [Bacteroidaceae bacterium]|nr:SLC13 family permease [Bacteroidaceae bacterium]
MFLDQIILGLSINAWITILSIIVIFIVLARSRVPVEIAFLGALTLLLITGVVTEEESLAGFGSEPVVIHASYFVIIAGLLHTGVLYWLSKNVLGDPRNYNNALLRLMIPTSLLAAILNSTNVVVMFIDIVKIWARKLNIAPSKLLLPLSYGATLGGMCTLLGDSSNLIIAGLYFNETGEQMNLFEPLIPGLILTVVGIIMVVLLQRFIPPRETVDESFETTSDYTVELLVPTDNPAVGETVADAGLYNVKGGSLVEIVRFDREIITPVPKDEWILGGDRLIYAGQINEILELKRTHGLAAADHHVWSINDIDTKRRMRTAYVTFGSDLIGISMANCDFEEKNNVALIAVARQGRRVKGQPREILLEAGDTLLLECPPKGEEQFERDTRRSLTFFDSHFVPQLGPKTITSAIIFAMMFVISSFHLIPLMAATMLAAGLMILTGCCRMTGITKYIEWELLIVLGVTVVFSTAITKTGIADSIAENVLDMCGSNPYVVMTVMCLLASIVSELVSDMGATAIFFPIMYQQAEILGCNPMPFAISLMLSVSISFASPIGSGTHMLIYGPGSFRFTDFARLGICMHIVLLTIALIVVNLIYPLYL